MIGVWGLRKVGVVGVVVVFVWVLIGKLVFGRIVVIRLVVNIVVIVLWLKCRYFMGKFFFDFCCGSLCYVWLNVNGWCGNRWCVL